MNEHKNICTQHTQYIRWNFIIFGGSVVIEQSTITKCEEREQHDRTIGIWKM